MAEYTIRAVAKAVKEYDGKYGTMKSYKVALVGPGVEPDEPVELSQKPETKPPVAGATLNGSIQDTEFGKKFKKDFQAQRTQGSGGKSPSDPYTMYLSYAKDIAVAMLKDGKLDEAAYGEVLSAVATGGKTLFESRQGAPEVPKPITETFGGGEPVQEDPFEGVELA